MPLYVTTLCHYSMSLLHVTNLYHYCILPVHATVWHYSMLPLNVYRWNLCENQRLKSVLEVIDKTVIWIYAMETTILPYTGIYVKNYMTYTTIKKNNYRLKDKFS